MVQARRLQGKRGVIRSFGKRKKVCLREETGQAGRISRLEKVLRIRLRESHAHRSSAVSLPKLWELRIRVYRNQGRQSGGLP
jgi:hypothetical protein